MITMNYAPITRSRPTSNGFSLRSGRRLSPKVRFPKGDGDRLDRTLTPFGSV